MIYSFVIDGRLPNLNDYIAACRGNKKYGNIMKRDAQDTVLWQLGSQHRGLKIKRPVIIHTRWYELNNRRDPDNVCGYGHKVILDALCDLDVLEDDSRRYIYGFTDWFYTDHQNPRIEIDIEEL